ncbi:MAG: hypothetical protein O9302_04540 [Cyclobacteriaceae bacterium]|jgi:hypothetical protein|nr:hypothetical protein [Flammeovirgaceae bacterium]MCZ8022926.1 hypothetical protein [Cytophagales bacterium]MCZ8327302.1 hypothetical protein [Cyclobacteriaceae bacterium]
MKKQLILIVMLLGVLTLSGFAEKPKKKAVKSFWVLETNIYSKTYSIINVYDANATLIRTIKLEGEYLNTLKRKDRKRINKLIEQ